MLLKNNPRTPAKYEKPIFGGITEALAALAVTVYNANFLRWLNVMFFTATSAADEIILSPRHNCYCLHLSEASTDN